MLELYRQTGKMALGSRLRQLGEQLAEQAARVYPLYGVTIDPKWFPVFFMLRTGECLSISALAEAIGHSHASVSKCVKEMTAAGFVSSQKVAGDGRVNQVCLTEQGRALVPRLERQSADAAAVVEELLQLSGNNLWEAISEFEYLLTERDFYTRVEDKFIAREQENIELRDFDDSYAEAFATLNYDWIEQYFTVEESDRAMLEAPREYILDKGGHIVMALANGEPVGTCALINHDGARWELAKMAVAASAQGKGIGYLMGRAILDKARQLGAESIFLESNTSLTPAIKLYRKLGFERMVGDPSPYARCNIQMQVLLEPSIGAIADSAS